MQRLHSGLILSPTAPVTSGIPSGWAASLLVDSAGQLLSSGDGPLGRTLSLASDTPAGGVRFLQSPALALCLVYCPRVAGLRSQQGPNQ